MNGKFEFCIDRGGTFTDVYAKCPDGSVVITKLLSCDQKNYTDAPSEAIKRIIGDFRGKNLEKNELIDGKLIGSIRMGTTVATNALLERKGEPFALVITKGFRDLLEIGDQSRPDIFDLKVKCPQIIYSDVIECDERVIMVNDKCCLNEMARLPRAKGTTGEEVIIERKPNLGALKEDLLTIKGKGIKNLAVSLIHSYTYPDHESQVEKLAKELGFEYVSLSSVVMPMVKIVERGLTSCVDAYLTPHIHRYLIGFSQNFKNGLQDVPVLFMQSDGGLVPVNHFTGSKAILSGPAGGVVGYAQTTRNDLEEDTPIIGFDMGGTSTDVSRFETHLEHTFESKISGVIIKSPQLDISTVAAGGGSRLFYRSQLFVVGPESAGADPGPVCYRKKGHLTVTDANIVLGRILPEFFPKIFGPNRDQPLDKDRAVEEMIKIADNINADRGHESNLSVEEVALGFVRVANESMCRPIRAMTEGKGYDTTNHILTCFGGAGGQHACSVARSLGIRKVFIHKHAGILSAVGMALADIVHEEQEPASCVYQSENFHLIDERIKFLYQKCQETLTKQGFVFGKNMFFECYLNLRYEKSDYSIMCQPHDTRDEHGPPNCLKSRFDESFRLRYQREFGFLIPNRKILVDDIRVRGMGRSGWDEEKVIENQSGLSGEPEKVVKVYFEKCGYQSCKVYRLEKIEPHKKIDGPCLIIQENSIILVEPNCCATITKYGNVLINIYSDSHQNDTSQSDENTIDPIALSIFSHRFMGIAEQMGRVLQRTAASTNIKERLDFSCALFGPDGGLVSNAPHIPVHLGSMQEAVQYQIHNYSDIEPGDVILTNHPCAGGSHLPDLTVITPVFHSNVEGPVFFVASRGHHSDIGGITPGSMPPNSTRLSQEGAVFISFKIVQKNVFQEENLIKIFQAPGKEEGNSGSRNLRDNINDLKAQIGANQRGVFLCNELINFYGLKTVQNYMKYIQKNAEFSVRTMLKNIVESLGECELEAEDSMDDGTSIKLKITIDKRNGEAIFDFTGTGLEVHLNTNAPKAITLSAIIYCLRSMVAHDIPLNQGCLSPIRVIIPKGSILWPSDEAAVVGGNVLTSQRVVDVILKAFRVCAASQGCMNNITFGDDSMGYYETVAGGSGAGPSWNGQSGVHTHMTNTRITDPEILERRYPVILREFKLNPESGGKGMFVGGNGTCRSLLFRKELSLSVLTERRVFPPYGLEGGEDGKKGSNVLLRSCGRKVNLGSKSLVNVYPGDIFELKTPGGGGYGPKE
ncbi:5-oxoprolinase [Brevipalpus obovatus]|uniref:5-oxoprolinase n=1 Tax=Brevipalpus obovatus TaxID=246614 RepID=UPI003D9DB8BD